MTLWTTLAVAGAITWLIRYSFIGLEGKHELPPTIRAALPFVPVAALMALVAPELVPLHTPVDPARLIAGVGALLIAWRTGHTLLTLAGGFLLLGLITTLQTSLA